MHKTFTPFCVNFSKGIWNWRKKKLQFGVGVNLRLLGKLVKPFIKEEKEVSTGL